MESGCHSDLLKVAIQFIFSSNEEERALAQPITWKRVERHYVRYKSTLLQEWPKLMDISALSLTKVREILIKRDNKQNLELLW